MKRHLNSTYENMKCILPPLPPPLKEAHYNYPPPPPHPHPPPTPPQEGYIYTIPPPHPPQEEYVYTPPPPRVPELSLLQHETKTEEPHFIYSTGDPFVFKVPSGRLPDHFMPWAHPFASVISGPTGSGKSVFVRRFVHNIQHMMMPWPDEFGGITTFINLCAEP